MSADTKNIDCQMLIRIVSLMAISMLALSACSNKYDMPILPTPSEAPQYYQPSIDDNYLIQVSDKLEIQSYYDRQLNQASVVRPDGRISLILIGEIYAVNKTPGALAAEVRKAYARLLSDPDINIVINEMSPRRMYIGGEVRTPSVHTIGHSLTLMQALTLSGGFKDSANNNQVLLLRNQDSDLVVHQIDTDKILTNEIPDVFLTQNDVIFVPKTNIADVGVFVDQYLSNIVPDFLRFNLNYQIGTVKTDQNTIITPP